MTQRPIGALTGLSLMAGFIAIVYLSIQASGSGLWQAHTVRPYQLTAKFADIGGLRARAPIKMSGVRIGWVESVAYDSSDHKAVVTLNVERRYDAIPCDSDATIQSAGLLGGNYVAITPGGADVFLRPGAQIESTRSAFGLEEAILKLLRSLSAT